MIKALINYLKILILTINYPKTGTKIFWMSNSQLKKLLELTWDIQS